MPPKPLAANISRVWKPKSTNEREIANPFHIYRALLRAVTYFPDPAAQVYLKNHISFKFRSPVRNRMREKTRLKKACSQIHSIERANRGVVEDVEKVLRLYYGRQGRRKRILIKNLLVPGEEDVPQDNEALGELLQSGLSNRVATILEPTAKFQAILTSQIRDLSRNMLEAHSKVKAIQKNPKIPAANLWGRPMPLRRQATIRHQWWAETLDRIFPPVPDQEWNRLRDLSTGVLPIPKLIPRRAHSAVEVEKRKAMEQINNRLVLQRLMQPARTKGKIDVNEKGNLVVDTGTNRYEFEKEIYNYQRTMRRLYASIWAITPKLTLNETTRKWDVEWGTHKSASHSGTISILPKSKEELFEGLQNFPPPGLKKKKGF